MLFHCEDLELYVKEIDPNKLNMLLINKSDFLSEKQRLAWLRHFEAKRIHVVFWSAALATIIDLEKINEVDEEADEDDSEDEHPVESSSDEDEQELNTNKFGVLSEDDTDKTDECERVQEIEPIKTLELVDQEEETEDDDEDEQVVEEELKQAPINEVLEQLPQDSPIDYEISPEEKEKCKILNREELIQLFKTVHKSCDKAKAGINTIGLVGYPNVGKSSTINALMEGKKVAVSETPGKTKHYQTLYVDDELLLCDCPGLVFPSFVSTRGELILNGILPIDQMRDYNEPINIISFFFLQIIFNIHCLI